MTAYTRLSLSIVARSVLSSALVVSVGTFATRELILDSSDKRRAWSVVATLALSVVALVTSVTRCWSCVARFASWSSSAFCAVTKLALGVVSVDGEGGESAYATAGMLIPMAATSANTEMDRVVKFFIGSPFTGTVLRVDSAIV